MSRGKFVLFGAIKSTKTLVHYFPLYFQKKKNLFPQPKLFLSPNVIGWEKPFPCAREYFLVALLHTTFFISSLNFYFVYIIYDLQFVKYI